jgi:hypothetical protein
MTAREKQLFEAQAQQLAAAQAALEAREAEREARTEERLNTIGSLIGHIVVSASLWYYVFWHVTEIAPGITMDEYYGRVGSLSDAQRSEYIYGYVLVILCTMGTRYFIQKIRSLF